MLNHVALLGRLAQDPVRRQTQTGIAVANFDLAVNAPTNNKDVPPDFIPIVCWRELAEFVSKYLTKGRQIVVEGKLSTNRYTDSEGKTHKRMEVRASRIFFADSKPAETGNASGDQGGAPAEYPGGFTPVEADELPF